MALSKCKECGGQVSTKAERCPHCGAKAPRKTSQLAWVLAALFVFALIGVLVGQGDPPSSGPEGDTSSYTTGSYTTIYYAKKAVKRLLKDPDSAKFRDVIFNPTGEGGAVVCGHFNSKNSFGAYSGFQRFISDADGKTLYLEEDTENFTGKWIQLCFPRLGRSP